MKQEHVEQLEFAKPRACDGGDLWRIVKSTGNLDVNSSYAYILLCNHFADTCMLAWADGRLVGASTGYIMPDRPDTLFVWQVAVDASMRGHGVAGRMLDRQIKAQGSRIRFIQTTVSPSNRSSRRLFDKLAERLGAPITSEEGFPESFFPEGNHEAEPLITIGPFNPQ